MGSKLSLIAKERQVKKFILNNADFLQLNPAEIKFVQLTLFEYKVKHVLGMLTLKL